MDLIQWREEYCTGISGVDFEHQKLIEEINSILGLIKGHVDPQTITERLGDIYGNISAHFALEERMMRQYRYDQYLQHMADHERLLDEIIDITEKFESSSTVDDPELQRVLSDWFQNHFKTHDARLHKLAQFSTHPVASSDDKTSLLGKARQRFSRLTRKSG